MSTITSKEAAQLAGVKPGTIRQWRARHGDFPHAKEYGGTLVFDSGQFLRWLESRGKLPVSKTFDTR